jgi:glucose/arabinose dehydrogenase
VRRRAAALAALFAAGGLVACGDDGGGDTTPEPSARSETTATTTAADPPTTAPVPFDQVRVALEEVARLDSPIAVAQRPGFDELVVAERGGTVRVLGGDGPSQPIVDVSDETAPEGERGLLGLTFSPDGEHLYVSYTDERGDSRVDEWSTGPGIGDVDAGSRRNVLMVDQPYPNHNGGNIVFGPDELLYFGLGDGGSAGDPEGRAQDPGELLGKILRIDPRASGDDPYAVPADNPFAGGGGRGEVYVTGVRNPWRFSFDRTTGDLWVGDVGQGSQEEIDFLPAGRVAGANLGWDRLEGTEPFEGEAPPGAVPPVFTYGRDEGYSVTGGYVYRGSAIPGLDGAYLFADYGVGEVRALDVEGGRVVAERSLGISTGPASLASFGEDADGELYVLSLEGPVYRLVPG